MPESWDRVANLQGWAAGAEPIELGPHSSYQYRHDPKHLCFVLARYKFVSKMLAGQPRVLEIGCGDAFGTPIVAQAVGDLTAVDPDERLLKDAARRLAWLPNCRFVIGPTPWQPFDAIYAIDVIEHLDGASEEAGMMRNVTRLLTPDGRCLFGTPNATASAYASPSSQMGHTNLKDADGLRSLLAQYFKTVFMFGFNDETLHTGFLPMAHYLFGIGVGVK